MGQDNTQTQVVLHPRRVASRLCCHATLSRACAWSPLGSDRTWNILMLAMFLAAAPTAQTAAPDAGPNVIFFLSDDHRADVLGCAGHPIVKTPHIDALAASGVRYTNAFVTTSICAASRATILSGLVERSHRFTFGTPPLAESLCDASYPARLRANGYRTGFVGKFGVKVAGGQATINRMFDSFVMLGHPYGKTQADGTTRHLTDITGDHAIEFIRTNPSDKPFCLSVSFNAAHAVDGDKLNHYPFPPTEAALYEGLAMPRPRLDGEMFFDRQPEFLKSSMNRERYFWRWDTPEKYDHNLRNYYRMLSGLDRNIGRVMHELEASGLADNTVIIFMGDNGYYMGERGFAGKWSHFDESLRVPMVVYDPRAAGSAGVTEDAIALNVDVAPTILGLAGVDAEAAPAGAGLALTSPVFGEREGFYCEHRMRHPDIPQWEGYRTREFKYVRYAGQTEGAELLYDLVADPDELTNLAADRAHRKTLRTMRRACEDHSKAYASQGAPVPRVLLLGDSISMGYHAFVVDDLPDALVVRPGENCAGTTKGGENIDTWLGIAGGGFDVIHFNFGLHDLKRVKPDGRNSNDAADPRQAELDAYERQLRAIVAKLMATGAELIFATTTPFPRRRAAPS